MSLSLSLSFIAPRLRVGQLMYVPTAPAFLQSCVRDVAERAANDDPRCSTHLRAKGRAGHQNHQHGPAQRLSVNGACP
ncbi:hypothetical protein C8R46DRAFT_1347936 [Mycena filopes]|nr:hypothetical protein C8R46DRAFT_1347936 [Mycena filopes]